MNKLVYGLADIFEWFFRIMFSTGAIVNLVFIFFITFFTVYWIREMKRNPEKARVHH